MHSFKKSTAKSCLSSKESHHQTVLNARMERTEACVSTVLVDWWMIDAHVTIGNQRNHLAPYTLLESSNCCCYDTSSLPSYFKHRITTPYFVYPDSHFRCSRCMLYQNAIALLENCRKLLLAVSFLEPSTATRNRGLGFMPHEGTEAPGVLVTLVTVLQIDSFPWIPEPLFLHS